MSNTLSNALPCESGLDTREFWDGVKDTIPLIVGAIPFGLIFGTLAMSEGLSIWATVGMSLFVFAGSAQFIAVSLLAVGTGVPLIIATTFIVNLRHLLYAANLVSHVKGFSHLWRMLMAFGLTDECFAVFSTRIGKTGRASRSYYLGSFLFMYGNWNLCTILGIVLGNSIPNIGEWGLEIAMSVTFIGMVIPYLKNRPMWAAVLVAGGVSLVAYPLPHKLGLMVAALAGISTGILFEMVQKRNS